MRVRLKVGGTRKQVASLWLPFKTTPWELQKGDTNTCKGIDKHVGVAQNWKARVGVTQVFALSHMADGFPYELPSGR